MTRRPLNRKIVLFLLLHILFIGRNLAQNSSFVDYLDTLTSIDQKVIDTADILAYHFVNTKKYEPMFRAGKKAWEVADRLMVNESDSLAMRLKFLGKLGCAQGLSMQGYYEEGLPLFESTIIEWENYFGSELRLASIYIGLSWAYAAFGDITKQIWAENQATRIAFLNTNEKSPYYSILGAYYLKLAKSYRELGQHEKSLQILSKAIKVYVTAGSNSIDLSRVFFDIGLIYQELGDTIKANLYLDSMQLHFSRAPESERKLRYQFSFKVNRGHVYHNLGDLKQAHKLYSKGLENALLYEKRYASLKKEITKRLLADIYHVRSKVNLELELYDEAEMDLKNAMKYWLTFNNKKSEYWRDMQLTEAAISASAGRPEEALEQLQTILKQYTSIFEVDWNTFQYEESLLLNPKILKILKKKAEIIYKAYNTKKLNLSLNEVLGHFSLGQQYMERMILSYSTLASVSISYDANRSLYDLPIDLVFQQYEGESTKQWAELLFQMMEKAKNMQLLSAIQSKREFIKMGVPEKLLQQEQEYQKQWILYEKLLTKELAKDEKNQKQIINYQALTNRYKISYDSVLLEIKQNYPAYFKATRQTEVVSLSNVQNQLEKKDLLYNFYWGSKKIYILAISSNRIKYWTVNKDAHFLNQLTTFATSVQNSPEDIPISAVSTFNRIGNFLFEKLLKKGLEDTEVSKLILLSDGQLNFLPWSALSTSINEVATDFSQLPYLIKQYQIQSEYVATLLQEQHSKSNLTYDYIGYAPSYKGLDWVANRGMSNFQIEQLYPGIYRDSMANLVYSISEVEQASNYFQDRMIFKQEKATESIFKKYRQKAAIQHFAMHGITNDTDPMLSLLLFHKSKDSLEDGNLFAYEIYNMNISANLAVLSACNTGGGVYQNGLGVMSLARAFKYAGCQDVLMSLWRANDHSAYKLITNFFEELNQKESKAAALQKATLRYLNENKNIKAMHPHYWAGFSLIGKGDPIAYHSNHLWIYFALLILLSTFLYFRVIRGRKPRI